MTRSGWRWTDDEIAAMIRVRKRGGTWQDAGNLFGVSWRCAEAAVRRFRTAPSRGAHAAWAEKRRQAIEAAEAGETNAAKIARAVGLHRVHCHQILARAGLDYEMRCEIAREMRA